MSKIIRSTLKRWAGTVTIADPLTLPQAETFQESMDLPEEGLKPQKYLLELDKIRVPGILACVEKWELENFELLPDGGLPFSPRLDTHKLIAWIHNEIRAVFLGELEVPNASSPTLTDPQATDTEAVS
jgi:hypothetical protein